MSARSLTHGTLLKIWCQNVQDVSVCTTYTSPMMGDSTTNSEHTLRMFSKCSHTSEMGDHTTRPRGDEYYLSHVAEYWSGPNRPTNDQYNGTSTLLVRTNVMPRRLVWFDPAFWCVGGNWWASATKCRETKTTRPRSPSYSLNADPSDESSARSRPSDIHVDHAFKMPLHIHIPICEYGIARVTMRAIETQRQWPQPHGATQPASVTSVASVQLTQHTPQRRDTCSTCVDVAPNICHTVLWCQHGWQSRQDLQWWDLAMAQEQPWLGPSYRSDTMGSSIRWFPFELQ